jgi:predicted nuclease with TOPRIM domain
LATAKVGHDPNPPISGELNYNDDIMRDPRVDWNLKTTEKKEINKLKLNNDEIKELLEKEKLEMDDLLKINNNLNLKVDELKDEINKVNNIITQYENDY